MLRVIKPKTRRARRALEKRAPKLNENPKKLILLHGTKTSAVVKDVLADLHSLKRAGGNAVKMAQKNDQIRPFEAGGETSLEFLAQKTDCSLFAFASHSKKRPHNLVLGRMYDFHIFDMVEVGVENYKSIREIGGGGKFAPQVGSKPCILFIGQEFESRPDLAQLKSILLDLFHGQAVDSLNLAGLDRVFICVAVGGKVLLRHCAIRLKKSGTKVPRIELVAAGPRLDLALRRVRVPGEELRKEAMKSPKVLVKKKVKNVSTDSLAGKVGRIYMPKQEVSTMALGKMKGLKRERREVAAQKAEGKPGPNARLKADARSVASGEKGNTGKPKAKKQRQE